MLLAEKEPTKKFTTTHDIGSLPVALAVLAVLILTVILPRRHGSAAVRTSWQQHHGLPLTHGRWLVGHLIAVLCYSM